MTIVQCPRCRDEVTVPAKASPKALVRCPLCLEEYLLREALADTPPTLLVIDGSVPEDEPALVGAGAAEMGGDYRLSGSGYAGMMDSSAPAGATAAPARPALKPTPRPKKKEKSAIAEGLKIIVGGLIGIAMAPLILWWVFGNDTFELGPMVSPYAPWIVPAKFRSVAPPPETVTAQSGNGSAAIGASGSPPAGLANSTPAPGPNSLQSHGNNRTNINGNARLEPGPELTSDPAAEQPGESLSLDNLPFEATLPTTPVKPAIGERPVPSPAPETIALDPVVLNPARPEVPEPVVPSNPEVTNPEVPKPPSETEPSPAVAGATTPEQFQTAALAAADALEKVNETPKTASVQERQQKYTTMFQAGSQLGRIATQLDIMDPAVSPWLSALRSFLADLSSTKGKISAVKHLAGVHFPARKDGEGILLAGTVKDIQPRGSAFELTLEAGKGLESLAIVSATELEGICAVGDEVVLLGRVVDDPQKYLPDYAGEQKRVVLMAYVEPAPKMP